MQIYNYPINQDIYNKFQSKKTYSPAQFNTQSTKTVPANESKEKINWRVVGTAAIGTLLTMLSISKFGKNKDFKFWNIDYKLPQMILLSLGAISGGLAGGIIGNKCPDSRKEKIKESIYQSINAILPASFVTLAGNSTKNDVLKIVGTAAAIGIGMPLAAVISDKINNNFIDKEHPSKRKIEYKDLLIHVDDIIVALSLLPYPILKSLHLQKVLPLLYANCGYEAGSK